MRIAHARRCLRDARYEFKTVNMAQLSDCAFIWSTDVRSLVNASRSLMWSCTRRGLLCRGGIAFGEIVEPDKEDRTIGRFVVGEAVTKAAGLERVGKGCRIFSDVDLPSNLHECLCQHAPFVALKNPLDPCRFGRIPLVPLPNEH